MPLTLHKATPEDVPHIARICVYALEDQSQRLKYGSLALEDVIPFFEKYIEKDVPGDGTAPYFVIRDDELDGKIISYIQWIHPRDPSLPPPPSSSETIISDDWNIAWLDEFERGILPMKERALNGRPAYVIGNMATDPAHERRGAASMLIRWPFEQADKDGALLFVDTQKGGPGQGCYGKLGFEKVEEHEFDLEKFGGHGKSTYIAMVRYPNKPSET